MLTELPPVSASVMKLVPVPLATPITLWMSLTRIVVPFVVSVRTSRPALPMMVSR